MHFGNNNNSDWNDIVFYLENRKWSSIKKKNTYFRWINQQIIYLFKTITIPIIYIQ